ncbi:hypothetical protein [Actinacidiphila acididurans]|uniref:Regulatory protein n=1 Tax=Actinacidiphila acididurans TaxID=2784346 RepID=A0ABS2TTW5_9ACTN|nr:hypothetical protein [Actinacidiphila acididurans]MBM9506773.1 hypothetical protein [Actinacidiphila acididurans]
MKVDSETIPLRSQYTRQIATDIETNRAEQERLKERLAQLQDDETYLVGLQVASAGAQSDASDTQEADAAADPASQDTALPQQRDAAPAPEAVSAPANGKGAGKQSGHKKAAATPRKRAASTAEARSARAKAPAKTAQGDAKNTEPSLRERVGAVLLQSLGQPRSAGEVVAALAQADPGHAVTPQAVRQSLESLVAASLAARERQGRSVYYTATAGSAPAASETAETEQQDEVAAKA